MKKSDKFYQILTLTFLSVSILTFIPDIYQSKKLSKLYNLSLDNLIEFDVELNEIEKEIEKSSEDRDKKIDWTKAWGKKYPVLISYQNKVNIPKYAKEIRRLFNNLEKEYGYSELDAMLVLKDILAHEYLDNKRNK